jgi:hypothetical protein
MAGFDREDKASPFLTFVRNEFLKGRGSALRRALADKTGAAEIVRKQGVRAPEKIAFILDDITRLREAELPDRFVLKFAHGWSARGVMILQKLDERTYFCHLSQRELDLPAIFERQRKVSDSFSGKRKEWLVEELIGTTIPGKTIPFDYKFYCFGRNIGMIVQIDRNSHPPKVCLLDENFSPLRPRKDYVLTSPNAQPGTPVVPLHALELRRSARNLSSVTESPFVSVDLYDSPDGPVFGEFTFSPGGTFRRMWVLSGELIDRFDALFRREGSGASKEPDDPERLPRPRPEVFGFLAGSVTNGSVRAADRLAALYAGYAKERRAQPLGPLAQSWSEIAAYLKRAQTHNREDRMRFLKKQAEAQV